MKVQKKNLEGGFATLAALLFSLFTLGIALSLVLRSQRGLMGTLQTSESLQAREAAEAGLAMVSAELNLPSNRRLLVSPTGFTTWGQRATSLKESERSSVTNPCLYGKGKERLLPSSSLISLVNPPSGSVQVPGTSGSRFIVKSIELSNSDRSRFFRSNRTGDVVQSTPPFSESLINFDSKSNTGIIKITIEGQLFKGDSASPFARSTISRGFRVVPKCCQLSPGGPNQEFGNDYRWCQTFPPFVVGLSNTTTDQKGGVYTLTDTIPELRSRTDILEEVPEILCYSPRDTSCSSSLKILDGVPITSDSIQFPDLPELDRNGIPCTKGSQNCTNSFGPSDAFSIELFNSNNGASGNSATNLYAKDYLRVRNEKVEICNKVNSSGSPLAATSFKYDTTPTIVPNSCIDLSRFCPQLKQGGYSTYHCRVRNIFVNDFGAKTDKEVSQNNTLFIDSSNGPIYLYIYDSWAKKTVSGSDPVLAQMRSFRFDLDSPPSVFSSIYTVGGYNDGQIQHVYCDPYTSSQFACVDDSRAKSSVSRVEILSDIRNDPSNTRDFTALIGDDGFVRDVFFWLPKANFHLAGDPNIQDLGGDSPQGKPQLSAGLWTNVMRFTRRTSQVYLPSQKDPFFPFLLSPSDRLKAPVYDWVIQGYTSTSLHQ